MELWGKNYYETYAAFVQVKKLLSCNIYWNTREWKYDI